MALCSFSDLVAESAFPSADFWGYNCTIRSATVRYTQVGWWSTSVWWYPWIPHLLAGVDVDEMTPLDLTGINEQESTKSASSFGTLFALNYPSVAPGGD